MAQRQFRSDDTSPNWQSIAFGNGTDGALTISGNTTEAPVDSACTGTSGTTSLSATNASFAAGQLILIHQTQGTGGGNWELNKISSYTAGTITTQFALCNTYATGAQVRTLKQYSSVTVNTGVTWTAKSWTGSVGGILAFLCNGTTTITGTISLNSVGMRGSSVPNNTQVNGIQGESEVGVGTNSTSANGTGGGGGHFGTNGSNGSGGGAGGGHSATGSNGGTDGAGTGGTAGGTAGVAALTTAVFGGAGGGGGGFNSSTGAGATGGNSGGLLLIISQSVSVTGAIQNNGGTGGNGPNPMGGGGGGAGGSILIKGQTVTLGTNLLQCAAGSGGAAGNGTANPGGNGSSGRIHVDYKTSLSGSTTTPTTDSTQDSTLFQVIAGGLFFQTY